MRETLDKVYRAFQAYPCPEALEGCPCCTSSDESRILVATPLRKIIAPQLEHYAFKALSTWGTLRDYKYFLPRILDLTAEGSLLCDWEVTLGKFAYGRFREWPVVEQEAIRGFIFAIWKDSIQSLNESKADALLCGAAVVIEDITPLLEYADASHPEFRAAYRARHTNQTKKNLLNSFWDTTNSNYKRVLEWVYPTLS